MLSVLNLSLKLHAAQSFWLLNKCVYNLGLKLGGGFNHILHGWVEDVVAK